MFLEALIEYRLCLHVRSGGGGGISYERVYVHVVKFIGGLSLRCKIHGGGDYVHVAKFMEGAQWLSGRVLDSRQKGSGFKPHWRHCIVVLEQDTFILA